MRVVPRLDAVKLARPAAGVGTRASRWTRPLVLVGAAASGASRNLQGGPARSRRLVISAIVEQDPRSSRRTSAGDAAGGGSTTSIQDSVGEACARKVLAQLVEKQVILAEAARLGITVPPKDVNEAVDQEIAQVKERLGGDAASSRPSRRRRYRGGAPQALRAGRPRPARHHAGRSRVQNKINVTDAEVRAYYQANHDSIRKRPEALELAHILVAFEPDSQQVRRARSRADSLHNVLSKPGTPPSSRSWRPASRTIRAAAAEASGPLRPRRHGPRIRRGGVPAQADGDLKPVRTRFGYHVIQVIEHFPKNDWHRSACTHIMIATRPSPADEERARSRRWALRDSAGARADFAGMVRRHSADAASRDSGGSLGEIPVPNLPPNMREF